MRFGALTLTSNLFLSPLAGYTNLPFRLVLRELGGLGLATTDLVNARSLIEKKARADYYRKVPPSLLRPAFREGLLKRLEAQLEAAQGCRPYSASSLSTGRVATLPGDVCDGEPDMAFFSLK